MSVELAECGCPKVYPLPDYVKEGAEVTCQNEYDLNLPDALKAELCLLSGIDPKDWKVTVAKGTKAIVTSMGGGYVTVEFRTPTPEGEQVICEGPWFDEMLRGDFAWQWCGTAEDALSKMMGFPHVS